jgi:hypothetical protein
MACRKFLGFQIESAGAIVFDPALESAGAVMQPVLLHAPQAETVPQFDVLAQHVVRCQAGAVRKLAA